LYGEEHESEPQGLGSAWDAPTNKNGPCVALALHQKPPRTVNRGPSQIALLLNTSNILSTGLRFNLPLCGKLACFKTNSHVLSASGKDCVGPCSVAGFVNVMLIDDTRAFVACMITHDPWRGYVCGIRVVQTGHTNSIKQPRFLNAVGLCSMSARLAIRRLSFEITTAIRGRWEIIETQGEAFRT
jgi:hypothetical protein